MLFFLSSHSSPPIATGDVLRPAGQGGSGWDDSEAFVKESVKSDTGTCAHLLTKSARKPRHQQGSPLSTGEIARPLNLEPEIGVRRIVPQITKKWIHRN